MCDFSGGSGGGWGVVTRDACLLGPVRQNVCQVCRIPLGLVPLWKILDSPLDFDQIICAQYKNVNFY